MLIKQIKTYLHKEYIPQSDMAAKIGIHPTTLSTILRRRRIFPKKYLQKLGKLLNISEGKMIELNYSIKETK